MSNRAQRRAAAKATPRYKRGLTKEDKIKKLYKNGITADDLQKSYTDGYREGQKDGVNYSLKTCYAAFILAMRKELGFGRERCKKLIRCADEIVCNALTSEETIEQVWNEIGLHLEFEEPFERVQEAE